MFHPPYLSSFKASNLVPHVGEVLGMCWALTLGKVDRRHSSVQFQVCDSQILGIKP